MILSELQNIIIDNINTLLQKRKDITLKSLSHAIGASDSYMQKVMSGNCIPTLEKLVELSNYFDIPVDMLLKPNTPESQEVQMMAAKLKQLSPEAITITHQQINYMMVAENKAVKHKDNP